MQDHMVIQRFPLRQGQHRAKHPAHHRGRQTRQLDGPAGLAGIRLTDAFDLLLHVRRDRSPLPQEQAEAEPGDKIPEQRHNNAHHIEQEQPV